MMDQSLDQSPQCFSLSLDDSGVLVAQFNPADGPPPDATMVRAAIDEQGYSHLDIQVEAITEFVQNCRVADAPVEAPIAFQHDGRFSLTMDSEKMTAWLTLTKPVGGKPVELAQVNEALTEQGIVHGILHAEINAAFALGACESTIVACGTPPVEGTPAVFETLFDQKQEESEEDELKSRKKYADFSFLVVVKQGDSLMRRTPAVQGAPGMNLLGEEILPPVLPDVAFAADLEGAAPHENDPNLLVATAGGQPSALDNGVIVHPLLDVENVDLGTGSIDFEGSLHVRGDVRMGMRIKVTGDVIVKGAVEAAHITAGGNVGIKGGIIGHPDVRTGTYAQSLPENTARIISGGSVQALFAENAHIEAAESILIGVSSRQCELSAAEEIIIGKGGKKGQLTGGTAQATLLVATGSLGTPSGSKTSVRVGVDPVLEHAIGGKEKELQKQMDEVDKAVKLLAYFKVHPEKGEDGVLEKVDALRVQSLDAIGKINAELREMREELARAEQGKVVASTDLYLGVEVYIGRLTWKPREDMGPTTIRYMAGKIFAEK